MCFSQPHRQVWLGWGGGGCRPLLLRMHMRMRPARTNTPTSLLLGRPASAASLLLACTCTTPLLPGARWWLAGLTDGAAASAHRSDRPLLLLLLLLLLGRSELGPPQKAAAPGEQLRIDGEVER
jgi:hypothetical protein